jgi:peptidoglycan/xylan/chitin deacetylase (PgdA/CDA1 family)
MYKLAARVFPNRLWYLPPQYPPVLYLTFDDGPIPEVTDWVRETLARHQAKATFFCIGENVDKHPQVLARLRADGHTLGHHTQNHWNGWQTPKQKYVANALEGAQKINSPWFRPPYGKITGGQARALRQAGFKLVMWNVLSKDYEPRVKPEVCWQRVKRQAQNGSIVVFHDSQKAAPRLKFALPKTLQHFSAQGFVFKGLPEG